MTAVPGLASVLAPGRDVAAITAVVRDAAARIRPCGQHATPAVEGLAKPPPAVMQPDVCAEGAAHMAPIGLVQHHCEAPTQL